MGPALGVIAGPSVYSRQPSRPSVFRIVAGAGPGVESGARPGRGYCRKGVTTASNSPAGMAPTLR